MRRTLCRCHIFPAAGRGLAAGNAERAVVACIAAFARNGLRIFTERAARRSSLTEAVEVTLRRLLIGYAIGVVIAPARSPDQHLICLRTRSA